MTTTYRYYWGGTKVYETTVASDTTVPTPMPTTGLTPGTADLTVTAQKAGELESVVSNAISLTLTSASITLDNSSAPWSANVHNTAGSSITSPSITTEGATRTLVCVVSYYDTQGDAYDPYPLTVAWVGSTPAGASGWTCRVWPVGTTGATTTDFSGTAQANHDATIHWTTQIWTATATQIVSGAQVRVSSGQSTDAFTGIISVYSFGNASSAVGSEAQHHTPMSEVNGANQLMQLTMTTTTDNSWIVGVLHWGNASSALTPMTGTTSDYNSGDNGEQGWGMAFHRVTTTAGAYTVGATNSQYAWAMCAIEVLPA